MELLVPIVVTVVIFIAILKRLHDWPWWPWYDDRGPTQSDMTTLNLHD